MPITLENLQSRDYKPIIHVVNAWWGGRQIDHLLPHLFFDHFQPTSFVMRDNDQLVGFLIGFISQTWPEIAYVHFIGVAPAYRQQHLATRLYEHFFQVARSKDCREVHCITSPVNKGSIAFHTRLGFEIQPGDSEVDNLPVTLDYDNKGGARVLFRYQL